MAQSNLPQLGMPIGANVALDATITDTVDTAIPVWQPNEKNFLGESLNLAAVIASLPSWLYEYEVPFFFEGLPTSSEILARHVFVRDCTFPVNYFRSRGNIRILPTDPITFTIKFSTNNVVYSTTSVTFSTLGVATFSNPSTIYVSEGDLVEISAPASADATARDIAMTLLANIPSSSTPARDSKFSTDADMTWDGYAWTANTDIMDHVLMTVVGTWAEGLRPQAIQMVVQRFSSTAFSNIGILYIDTNYAYQWGNDDYGYLSGSGPADFTHTAEIFSAPANSFLVDCRRIDLYKNGGGTTLFAGDKIISIKFKLAGVWTEELY